MTDNQANNLLENARLKLTTVVGIIILLLGNVSGVAYLIVHVTHGVEGFNNRVEVVEADVEMLKRTKRDKGIFSWNREAQRIWAADLAEKNPTLYVPDPQNLKYQSYD